MTRPNIQKELEVDYASRRGAAVKLSVHSTTQQVGRLVASALIDRLACRAFLEELSCTM